LLRLLVIVALAFLTKSSETGGSGDDDSPLSFNEMRNERDAMQDIFKREMARHEEQNANLKEQKDELEEQNDMLQERNARLEQNRNEELQQDKQQQDLRRENEVVRLANSEINQSITRQRDSILASCLRDAAGHQCDETWRAGNHRKDKIKNCQKYKDSYWCDYQGKYWFRWEERWGTFEDYADADGRTALVCPQCGCGRGCRQRTRLVDGYNERSGRLEVFMNGQWGTVCDAGMKYGGRGAKIAEVVCKSLGFHKGGLWHDKDRFGNAAEGVPMHIVSVKCKGTEETVIDCPQRQNVVCVRHWYKDGWARGHVGIECRR